MTCVELAIRCFVNRAERQAALGQPDTALPSQRGTLPLARLDKAGARIAELR